MSQSLRIQPTEAYHSNLVPFSLADEIWNDREPVLSYDTTAEVVMYLRVF